jgi:hypothetical protein
MQSVGATMINEVQAMREATMRVLEQSRADREAIAQMLNHLEIYHGFAAQGAAHRRHG